MTYLAFPAFLKAGVDDDILCEGNPQVLQFGANGTHPLSNIQWTQIPNGAPSLALSNSTISNPTLAVPALAAGTNLLYQVSAVVDSCNVVDTVRIHVVDTPSVNFQVVPASAAAATDGAATISATGNLAQFNYAWQTGATAAAINNLAVGNYWVTTTDFYGCQAVDSATVSFGSTIQTLAQAPPPFNIFPNPTKDRQIHIHFHTASTAPIQCSIYNSLGQLIPFQYEVQASQKQHRLELKQAISGIYWLQIQIGERTYTQKVVLN